MRSTVRLVSSPQKSSVGALATAAGRHCGRSPRPPSSSRNRHSKSPHANKNPTPAPARHPAARRPPARRRRALPGRHRARGQGRAVLLRARRRAWRPATATASTGRGIPSRRRTRPPRTGPSSTPRSSPRVYRIAGPHPLAVRLLQALLAGLLLPWLTYRLARRMLASPSPEHRRGSGAQERGPGGEVVPLLAAFLAAIYAYFVLYGAMVQTEAFYICALLWSLERALALGESLTALAPAHLTPQHSPSASAWASRRCCASRSCRGSSCCSPGCCGRATAAATCALPSSQP